MRILVLIAALSLCGYSFAESPPIPPAKNQAKGANKSQGISYDLQTISAVIPLSGNVEISGNLKTNTDTNSQGGKEEHSKWTDVLLAISTVLLTIVTAGLVWIGIQQERNSKRHERAYLICGGLYGVPNPVINKDATYRPRAIDYHGPWRMVIRNYGRSHGCILKIEWGLCPKDEFPIEESVSSIIKSGKFKITPVDVQEIFPPSRDERYPYRQVEFKERKIDHVFFGKITYEDIFHEKHHSTWAFWHREKHSDTIGKSYAEDWS
jgi:hypothetical protein